MNCKKVAICTPIYKRKLDISEYTNLKISEANNPKIKKIFFAPCTLNLDYYKKNFKNHHIIKFSNFYFKNVECYSKLLLSENFYRKFIRFSHIIIHQPDSIIIKNLKNLDIKNYDYVGSPSKYKTPNFNTFYKNKDFSYENRKLNFLGKFLKKTKRLIDYEIKIKSISFNLINIYLILKKYFKFMIINKKYYDIGLNGGLSIRKVGKFIEILKNTPNKKKIKAPEDHVYSYFANNDKLKIPTYKKLKKIFSEKWTKDVYGYHKLDLYDNDSLNKIYKKFSNFKKNQI